MYLDELFGLTGQTAIVTGGGQGIGQVIAAGLARVGAEVAVLCRSGADETLEMIRKENGKAFFVRCDVTNEDDVKNAVAAVVEKTGRIDVLFNNAGICYHKTAFEATTEEFRTCIDVNLTGEYLMAREVAKVMIEKGIHGRIINMASMSGTIVNVPQMQAAYNASKAAVIHLTKSLAIEWIEDGIRVNSLSPGYVETPMATDPNFVPTELREAWMKLFPLHRMAKPEELIPPILYLASPAAGYTTGSDVIVDGAYSIL